MHKSKGLRQAYEMQDFAYGAAMALKDALSKDGQVVNVSKDDASAIGTLVKAWETAQERIRIHRGKPLPGALRPEQRRSRPAAGALLAINRDAADQQSAAAAPDQSAAA